MGLSGSSFEGCNDCNLEGSVLVYGDPLYVLEETKGGTRLVNFHGVLIGFNEVIKPG